MPCSAATVSGIVCEAETASRARAEALRRGTPRRTRPSPSPSSGRSPREVDAAADQLVAARRRVVERLRVAEVEPQRRREREHDDQPDDDHREHAGDDLASGKRSAASTNRPASSAGEARLRERQHAARPRAPRAQRAASADVARPPLPEQHAGEPEHHEREEAAVDVRVEEERVDPEVLLELVRGDHLRVEQQRARRVLDEADRDEREREHRRARRGRRAAAAATTRCRAAARTAARTGRRRRRSARAPCRATSSRTPAARRARPRRRAATRARRSRAAGRTPRRRGSAAPPTRARRPRSRGRAGRAGSRSCPPASTGMRNGSAASAASGSAAAGGAKSTASGTTTSAAADEPAAEREQRALAHGVELRRLPDRRDQQHGRERERARASPTRACRAPSAEHRRGRERRRDDDPERAHATRARPRGVDVTVAASSRKRPDLRLAPRRMSAMLRVSCWTGTERPLQPRAPLRQADADHHPLAERRERERGPRLRRVLARLLGLLERLLVDARRAPTRRRSSTARDSSSVGEAGQLSTPVSRPVPRSSAIGSSGCGALEPAHAGERRRRTGPPSAGGSGRSSRSRATSTPRRSESVPNDATRPPPLA